MTGVAYATSAEMAGELGPFPRYKENADNMLRVIRNHRRAAHGLSRATRASRSTRCRSTTPPAPISASSSAPAPAGIRPSRSAKPRLPQRAGHRDRAHGTIGLVMDCDTTGIEPDFALVKFKKLAGGGYFKIINRAVPDALRVLGYRESEIAEIEAYAVGHGSLRQAPAINPGSLAPRASRTRRSRPSRRG
jgi:ribonucleoside-diphosphate reductase alpha chain